MTKDEALKLALEALEDTEYSHDRYEAITAVKEALAQPEQEPVATKWLAEMIMSDCGFSTEYKPLLDRIIGRIEAYDRANTQTQPEPEPVATDWERIARVQDAKLRAMCNEAGGFEKLCEVMDKYERTTPPQRKPLTNEEIDEISKKHIAEGTRSFEVFARAIEAAHGIKDET